MEIRLNPEHRLHELAAAYRTRGRLQIRDFLAEASAEAILSELVGLPWGLAFNCGDKVVELDAAAVARLTPAEGQRLLASIHQGAREGYQFLYSYYPLLSAYFRPDHPRIPLFAVYEFLNSAPFLGFIRNLTGLQGIRWADAQATCFRPGQFLKTHTDEAPAERRAAAYVLNFTKDWGPDWGGFLQFFNARFDVEEAFKPIFNALNIFSIPANHSVSMVATYTRANRYSITGWFREDEPPGPIGPGVR